MASRARLIAACGAMIALDLVGMAIAQTPGFHLVGRYQNAGGSRAYSLSADGRVAAGWTSPFGMGFTWTAAGGRVDYGQEFYSAIGTSTTAAISGDATTVVGSSASASTGVFRAFRWSGPGTFQSLGVTSGHEASEALGVSGDGSVIVGYSSSNLGAIGEAFRWTATTGIQSLGYARPGHIVSRATGVSRDGSTIVGWSASAGGFSDAFVWTAGGGMTILPALPNTPGQQSYAYATNFDGSIVVGESGPGPSAALWRNGQVIDLGLIPGFGYSGARSVSDDGNVVGGFLAAGPDLSACVWTPTRGMETLAAYLLANGVTVPPGWSLMDCYAVSGDGLTFAGYAGLPSGETQGFVATVPAPPAALALALGITVATDRKRRRCSQSFVRKALTTLPR